LAQDKTRFDVEKSWRSCFQAILAGDFLSPVFIGVVYRDNFPTSNPFTGNALWGDRAQLLEQAFEERYHRMTTGERAITCRNFADYEQAKAGEETGLCRRFGYHPNSDASSSWIPLLFINGTSVSTGRRIIISDIRIGSPYGEKKEPLLPFAYDLWELRDEQANLTTSGRAPSDMRLPDIRLSTAAGLSARFPVISPEAVIRDGRDRETIDRAVDGGYFENDGLATIADVAAALNAYGLKSVVIRVVNDPRPLQDDPPLARDRPPRPHDDARTPFDGLASIFRALTATRSGHEDDHEAYLRSVLNEQSERIYPINVYALSPNRLSKSREDTKESRVAAQLCRRPLKESGYMEFVSMSWWMSQPVQAYLDAQLCIGQNIDRLICELHEGRSASGGLCSAQNAAVESKR
jgi:hypothetical protein